MKQYLFRLLADLRFAILILLLIGFCSIAGTIIEQNQSIEVYKINYPLSNPIFGFLSWDQILYFGLDHVYQTWWFFTLIFLFGLSLTLCSFLQQLPSLKIARRCQFFRTTEQFYRLNITTILDRVYFNQVISRIKLRKYSMFQQKNVIYCYKGLLGRIAPIIVHFSIILVLLGTIIGAFFGFKAQEIIPNTESFHIQNILGSGPLTRVPTTAIRVNSFWITYTKQKTISQFYSDLSVLDQTGTEVTRKTVSVNYPLIYQNTYYYQTDWNLLGLRFQESNREAVEYPLINLPINQNKIWLTWISKDASFKQGFLVIVDNLEGYCSAYDENGEFLGNVELNEKGEFVKSAALSQMIGSTGLQMKTDPGLLIIYLGFFFLMVSTLLSYITYSQIWVVRKNRQIFIGGTTNRATFEFELEFFKFAKSSYKFGK